MGKFNYSCFKAYDIRGKIGEELSFDLVYNIGKALAVFLKAKKIVVGCDIRLTSPEFKAKLTQGLLDMGVDVVDIGMTGTEEIYFATSYLNLDGGVQVTASHNPKDYNGLKIVSKNSIPIGLDTGLNEIRNLIENEELKPVANKGSYSQLNLHKEYIDKLLSFINIDKLKGGKKLKLHFNIGNGAAGQVTKLIQNRLEELGANLEFVYQFDNPDGNFPNGIPNPLLVENRLVTSTTLLENKADLGIAFDGDFDRCFFFDEKGSFIDGYYICGLLAQAFLAEVPGSAIVHEPRLFWNTLDVINQNKGIPVVSKSGHSFIKATLRQENAIYGGEMSAHHYFRDYYYCDSGMIPWLLVVQLLKSTGKTLSELVGAMQDKFPCSDELNFRVSSIDTVMSELLKTYQDKAESFDNIDGYSFDFGSWRFNVRASNTEPLLRVNIETKGDKELLEQKTLELNDFVTRFV